jgi:hypothetical protein
VGNHEQRTQTLMDAQDRRNELLVASATAGPMLLEARRGLLQVGDDPHGRAVGETDFVHVADAPQRNVLCEIESQALEGPFKAWPIEQDIRPGIEFESIETAA